MYTPFIQIQENKQGSFNEKTKSLKCIVYELYKMLECEEWSVVKRILSSSSNHSLKRICL